MEWVGAVKVDKRGAAPVYAQVAGALRGAIVSGRLAVGASVGEERVLAEKLGLSRMTVRKAISAVVAEGLARRVRGRGTFVAEPVGTAGTFAGGGAAGGEGSDAVWRVAVLAPFAQGDLNARSFYFRIFQGMQAAVAEWARTPVAGSAAGPAAGHAGGGLAMELLYREVSASTAGVAGPLDAIKVGEQVAQLNADRSIGAVVVLGIADGRLLAGLAALVKPVVLVDSDWLPGAPPADKVRLENRESSRAAVEHLVALGHRRIGMLNFVPDTKSARARREAYVAALAKHGLRAPAGQPVTCELTGTAAYATMRALFGAGNRTDTDATRTITDRARTEASEERLPTAWFCASDELAVGLMAAAKDSGLNIPAAVSVVGFGDLGHFAWPPLSSVRVPMEEMGRQAVRLCVRRRLDRRAAVEEVVVAGELVVRGTSAPVLKKA